MPLKDQVAVITGASSGIGEAVARDLSDAGMKLVLSARREDRLRGLADTCQHAEVLAGDITDPDMAQKLIDRALEAYGRCDVVFNNAGVILAGKVDDIDVDRVCRMVRLNVEAAFRLAYTALKHFRKAGSGHLVNTSSILGTKTRPTVGAYAGTKYAIEALSESLRMELAGDDIKVSCIEPGLVMTELHADWAEHPKQIFDIKAPLVPDDIARAVRFILEQPAHVCIPRMLVTPGEQSL